MTETPLFQHRQPRALGPAGAGRHKTQNSALLALALATLAYLLSPFWPELKWIYVASLVISVLVIARIAISKKLSLKKSFFLSVLFVAAFIPSIFYAELDQAWALGQFGSLALRIAPAVLIAAVPIVEKDTLQTASVRILALSVAIYLLWAADIPRAIGVPGNFENVGGAAIVATLPFAMVRKKYALCAIAVAALVISDSRMGGFLSLFAVFMVIAMRTAPSKIVARYTVIAPVIAAAFVVILNIGVFFPEFAPRLDEYGNDRVRRAMQFLSLQAIRENPFLGIGMGQINLFTERLWGEEVLAHGFVSFVWSQSGLVPFLLFLYVSFLSIYGPAKSFMRSGNRTEMALAVSNICGFLFFLTRPQQDNPIYFFYLFWGIRFAINARTEGRAPAGG